MFSPAVLKLTRNSQVFLYANWSGHLRRTKVNPRALVCWKCGLGFSRETDPLLYSRRGRTYHLVCSIQTNQVDADLLGNVVRQNRGLLDVILNSKNKGLLYSLGITSGGER
jgi:hypothetical protein